MKMRTGRYWLNIFLAAVAILFVGLGGAVTALSYRQARIYMHPVRSIATGDLLKESNIPYREIELTAEDGVKLSAWYTPPQPALSGGEGNGAVILVAHGHGAYKQEDIYALLAGHGYGVIAWDFRAHGESGGGFTSLGYYEVMDAKAALDFVLSQPDVKHIGAWGGSMGAVTMIRAAAKYPQIEALVSDSAFSTLPDELNIRVPYPVLNPLIRFFAEQQTGLDLDLVRPVDDIRRISPRPVLIIQSSNDRMVPLDSALRLYENAGKPKELWIVDKANHLSIYARYPETYEEKVLGFFERRLLK
jgi:fermentation-respiration switch protein FrsA (DUF1100 family)